MTEVSAPPGSGKTLLVRSWISESGLAERTAWVPVQGEERDPQRFWLSVLGALRDTAAGSKLVRPLTAAPDLDGWAVVERLLTDLGGLEDRVWLVIDDVHELRSAEVLRQLQLLLMRAPAGLRFVLATRRARAAGPVPGRRDRRGCGAGRADGCPGHSLRTAPVFAALGRATTWLGPAGNGTRAKLVLNNWLADLTETTAETLSFARQLDLDPAAIVDLLESTPLGSPYAVQKARSMLAGDFTPAFALKHALKEQTITTTMCPHCGVGIPGVRQAVPDHPSPGIRP